MTPNTPHGDDGIGRFASLVEPVRRALYRWVAAQPEPVTRERAAEAVGVAPHVAKFHLERLVADGLLSADYRRDEGRGGPGAGRPAKRYRRPASDEIAVSIPPRRYDLAGTILARAVGEAARHGAPVLDTVKTVASAEGRTIAAAGDRGGRRSARRRVADVLAAHGYEPVDERNALVLANCPFHALVQHETELVCTMNHALVSGVVDALAPGALTAVLCPQTGRCCVRVEPV